MKKHNVVVAGIAALLVIVALLWRFLPGLWPAVGPAAPIPTPDVSPAATSGDGPLNTAPGWRSELLTDGIDGARDMAVDADGTVWVSQTSKGFISRLELQNGKLVWKEVVWEGLRKPHGLAFDPEHPRVLYFAEEHQISRWDSTSLDNPRETVAVLPTGGRHFTRSLAFGPDGRLYVSIGSTCDVCYEKDPEISTILSMNADGSDRRIEATGLRNAVFIGFESSLPGSHLWMTEMGRDRLGDNLPPDEVNSFDPQGEAPDFGWPLCYGDRVHDTDFDDNVYIRNPCEDTVPPSIELPAHVAPLGFDFMNDNSILVAYHGSWNATVPVGYKVVRWTEISAGVWTSSDFLTGFLSGRSAIGRPVDVLRLDDGSVLVSDDKAGAIWRVAPLR